MKTYSMNDAPLKIFGVPFYERTGRLERVPEELREKLERLKILGRRVPGARIGFRTDSKTLKVRMVLETLSVSREMSLFSGQSINVMAGNRRNARFLGLVVPADYESKTAEQEFRLSGEMQDIMLYLPRNEIVETVEISVDDDAVIEAPTPYRNGTVVYYGSSITAGGCCTRITNAYTTLLSDWLDFDFYNLGFSGSARGELEMADYINTFDMDVFVYDYDHNAPDAEHLRATHEPFFKRFREKHPTTPVIITSRPDIVGGTVFDARREAVRQTYLNAVASGDENVWFIDGETFFGKEDRELCTLDRCHPNDLGMYRMAKVYEPVLREILEKIGKRREDSQYGKCRNG